MNAAASDGDHRLTRPVSGFDIARPSRTATLCQRNVDQSARGQSPIGDERDPTTIVAPSSLRASSRATARGRPFRTSCVRPGGSRRSLVSARASSDAESHSQLAASTRLIRGASQEHARNRAERSLHVTAIVVGSCAPPRAWSRDAQRRCGFSTTATTRMPGWSVRAVSSPSSAVGARTSATRAAGYRSPRWARTGTRR
jgi:hypothetical protein